MKSLTIEQRKTENDIRIIGLVTLAGFMIFMNMNDTINEFIKDPSTQILIRVAGTAFLQLSIAGLGSIIVCLFRRETLAQMGLQKRGALKAITGAFVCFIPHLIYIFASGNFTGYKPLSVLLSDEVMSSTVFNKILGILIIGIAWGVFEGFNYYIISQKINQRYPNKVNIGAITCAFICILFHPFNTSFWGIVEIITTILFIYGMIFHASKTQNSWGCMLAFLFLWNAF